MNKIKLGRQMLGFTQWELSLRTKIRPSKISLFERGWQRPNAEEAEQIAHILELEPDELTEEIDLRLLKNPQSA